MYFPIVVSVYQHCEHGRFDEMGRKLNVRQASSAVVDALTGAAEVAVGPFSVSGALPEHPSPGFPTTRP